MSSRKRIHRDQRLLASDVGPEDGLDPRFLPRYPGRRGAPGRKSLQLCEQVVQVLSSALTGGCDDDVLRDLLVVEVVPAPDSSRLLVTLTASPAAGQLDPADVLERLERHKVRLRAEVAAAIHRRRVPELSYRLVQ